MKEKFKSFVLIVLVILNLILGSQVLSTKKLWSDDGYNFFISLSNFKLSDIWDRITNSFKNNTLNESHLDAPELIIVNTGDQTTRRSFNASDDEFMNLSEISSAFLNDAFSGKKQYDKVSTDEFYTALTAKSVYLRYPTEYDSSLFSYLLGTGDTAVADQISSIRNIVISTNGYIYIEDSESRDIFRYKSLLDTENLTLAIDECAENITGNAPVINYAFDLGFDKAFATQKTVLSPMIPIYSESFSVETVYSENPLKSSGGINEATVSEILPLFGMNPNSLRRYTEVDGTLVFVENSSTLKISESGYLEYKATTKEDGVSLRKNTSSKYDIVASLGSFVDNINLASGSNATIKISSKLTAKELDSGIFSVSLDYIVNGIPVVFKSNDVAISMTVTDGRITEYRQHLMEFKKSGENSEVQNYITALDEAIVKFENQINGIEISGMDIAYETDGTFGELFPEWNVSIKEIVIG